MPTYKKQGMPDIKIISFYNVTVFEKTTIQKKKPAMTFIMPHLSAHEDSNPFHLAYQECIEEFKFLKNEQIEDKDKISFTIYGKTKINKAIRAFQLLHEQNKDPSFNEENEKIMQDLEEDAKELNPKPPAKYSKAFSDFVKDESKPLLPESSHKNDWVTSKENQNESYVYKKLSGTTESEAEHFNAICALLLLNDHHPKVTSVHGEYSERVGVVARTLPEFTTIRDYVMKHGKINKQFYIEKNFTQIFVQALLEEDVDCNNENYGFYVHPGKGLIIVKLDPGRASWEKTAKYYGLAPEGKDSNYSTRPDLTFPIYIEDIHSFPRLEYAKPLRWITDKYQCNYFDDNVLKEVATDPECIKQKYFLLLKRVLISDEVYQIFSEASFSSTKKQNEYSKYKINKTIELRKVLLQDLQFHQYFFSHPQSFDAIQNEFIYFNETYLKEEIELHVKRDNVSNLYDQLVNELYESYENIITAFKNNDIKQLLFYKDYILTPHLLTNAFNYYRLDTELAQAIYSTIIANDLNCKKPNLNVYIPLLSDSNFDLEKRLNDDGQDHLTLGELLLKKAEKNDIDLILAIWEKNPSWIDINKIKTLFPHINADHFVNEIAPKLLILAYKFKDNYAEKSTEIFNHLNTHSYFLKKSNILGISVKKWPEALDRNEVINWINSKSALQSKKQIIEEKIEAMQQALSQSSSELINPKTKKKFVEEVQTKLGEIQNNPNTR